MNKNFLELPKSRSSSVSTNYSSRSVKSQKSVRKHKKVVQEAAPMVIRKANEIKLLNRFPDRIEDAEQKISVTLCQPSWHHACKVAVQTSVLDLSFVCIKPGACDQTQARNHWFCEHVAQKNLLYNDSEAPARKIYGDLLYTTIYKYYGELAGNIVQEIVVYNSLAQIIVIVKNEDIRNHVCEKIVKDMRRRLISKVYRAVEPFFILENECEKVTFQLLKNLSLSELFAILRDVDLLKSKVGEMHQPQLTQAQKWQFTMMQGELVRI